jgi:hypothetical protein
MGGAMTIERRPPSDPRAVARDIPGIFDALFPQLTPGVVAHFNRKAIRAPDCNSVPQALVEASSLQRAMLFELAIAAGEQLLQGEAPVDWGRSLEVAVERQRRHFDARLPVELSTADMEVGRLVAENLVTIIEYLRRQAEGEGLVRSPVIPGFQWVASSVGDFALGSRLIEVKCTRKHFSSADYRQIVMYWLLSYAHSVEKRSPEWSHAILMNPRRNTVLTLPFEEIVGVIAGGTSKVELLELFSAVVGDRSRLGPTAGLDALE